MIGHSPGCGRFAPSPTGELHLGNLRTALIAWLVARSQGDKFLVRIEDLDAGRVREAHVGGQLADLESLGIDWDAAPVRQSQRAGLHAAVLARLGSRGLTYPCFCSRREIREAASAPHESAGEVPYPGTCAALDAAALKRLQAAGAEYALRLRSGAVEVDFADRLAGPQSGVVDDFVLVRRDGALAYNLAVVVDDNEQGITEVVRGDDLLASTARQALLYDLLGWARPVWTHVPLVVGPDGARLAKRHGSVTLAALARDGWPAARVVGLLAQSLGIANAAGANRAGDLIGGFRLDSMPDRPRVFRAPSADRSSPGPSRG